MWTFFVPTRQKLLTAFVIVLTLWASGQISSYLSTILVWRSAVFDQMSKNISEQDPVQLQKVFQEFFRSAAQVRDALLLLPLIEWGTRILLAYFAACVIAAILLERTMPNALQPLVATEPLEQTPPTGGRAPMLAITATIAAIVALVVFYLIGLF